MIAHQCQTLIGNASQAGTARRNFSVQTCNLSVSGLVRRMHFAAGPLAVGDSFEVVTSHPLDASRKGDANMRLLISAILMLFLVSAGCTESNETASTSKTPATTVDSLTDDSGDDLEEETEENLGDETAKAFDDDDFEPFDTETEEDEDGDEDDDDFDFSSEDDEDE